MNPVSRIANNIRCLPHSLLRAGRFDRKIEVNAPRGEDAEEIVAHYLKTKKLADSVDTRTISRILNGSSCAELETILNESAILATYKRKPHLDIDDIAKVYGFQISKPKEKIFV